MWRIVPPARTSRGCAPCQMPAPCAFVDCRRPLLGPCTLEARPSRPSLCARGCHHHRCRA
eukprot:2960895-Pleurochrysis_carterae.AAC.4